MFHHFRSLTLNDYLQQNDFVWSRGANHRFTISGVPFTETGKWNTR